MNAHLSLGVIGHVDHGKTSLVKALTGTDTDRLKEEKARGMSIVLGFAHLACEEGILDLIDVPGHEDFIRTMIAGATGIDAALLVVDAREGVKPQTVEHLAITELIGIRRGVVAITKCDLVSDAERQACLQQLRRLLKAGYLEFAPVVFTSTETGEGIDALKLALRGLLGKQAASEAGSGFYLPIDRVFSIAGHGTVVTGTVRQGRIAVGDEVELMPGRKTATVRQLEFHGQAVDTVYAGQRAGVNLRNVGLSELKRGDALASVGLLTPSTLLDVRISLSHQQEKPLRDGQRVRVLFGTSDAIAHVRLLSGEPIEPGRAGLAQLRTAQPVASVQGEAFILRSDSPSLTIGGGRILDPSPARHKRLDAAVLARLDILSSGSDAQILLEQLKRAGHDGIALDTLAAKSGQAQSLLSDILAASPFARIIERRVFYQPALAALAERLIEILARFHREHPTRLGAPLALCRAGLPAGVGESTFRFVLRDLATKQQIAVHNGLASIAGFDPIALLDEEHRTLAADIEERFRQGGAMPPDIGEVMQGDPRQERLLRMLVEQGRLLMLTGQQASHKIVFHRDVITDISARMRQAFPPPTPFTVSDFRASLGTTRKFAVPLLEHFDRIATTRRRGDARILLAADAFIRNDEPAPPGARRGQAKPP